MRKDLKMVNINARVKTVSDTVGPICCVDSLSTISQSLYAAKEPTESIFIALSYISSAFTEEPEVNTNSFS